jgi:hypothetical protein
VNTRVRRAQLSQVTLTGSGINEGFLYGFSGHLSGFGRVWL